MQHHTPPSSRRTARIGRSGLLIALGAMLVVSTATNAAAAVDMAVPATAQVTVVHGLRGQLVDVYVDGKMLLEGFEPDRLTDPMTVAVGPHTVDLRPAGTDPGAKPKASATVDLTPGPVAVVAHFAIDGSWTMSLFRNDDSPLASGAGRVLLRNAAAIQSVDVTLGQSEKTGIAVGKETVEDLPGAIYPVKVDVGGDSLLADDDVTVNPGEYLALYLVGTPKNAAWLAQRIPANAAVPAAVDAGDSGLRTPRGTALPGVLVGAAGASVLAGQALRRARWRRRAALAA